MATSLTELLTGLPYLDNQKEPVLTLAELYVKYPDGGSMGWYAFVKELKSFAYWDIDTESWENTNKLSLDSATAAALSAAAALLSEQTAEGYKDAAESSKNTAVAAAGTATAQASAAAQSALEAGESAISADDAKTAAEAAEISAEAARDTALANNDLLGGIAYNAAAPTPGKSGRYYFTTGGSCSWITGGAATVAAGDQVIVVYAAPSTYTYTHVVRADIAQELGEGEGVVISQRVVTDELYTKKDIILSLSITSYASHRIGKIAEFTTTTSSYDGVGLSASMTNKMSALKYIFKSISKDSVQDAKLQRIGIKTDDKFQLLFTKKTSGANTIYSVWALIFAYENTDIDFDALTIRGSVVSNLIQSPSYEIVADYNASLSYLNGIGETVIAEDVYLLKSEIVNDLTTGGTQVPLSAEQGKTLNESIASSDAEIQLLKERGGVTYQVTEDYEEISSVAQRNDMLLDTTSHYVADVDYDIIAFPVVAGDLIKITGQVNKPCYGIFSTQISAIDAPYYKGTIFNNTLSEVVDIDEIVVVPADALYARISKAKALTLQIFKLIEYKKVGNKDESGIDVTFKPDVTDTDLLDVINGIKTVETIVYPDKVYSVCNDIVQTDQGFNSRNYAPCLYVDHFLKLSEKKNVKFLSNNSDKLPFYAPISSDNATYNGNVDVKTTTLTDKLSGDIVEVDLSISHISTKASVTSAAFPKILVIGDSVTNKFLADKPTSLTANNPTAYWSHARKFFKLDKIDAGSGHDCLFVGKQTSHQFIVNAETIKCYAEGRGGWTTRNYLYDETVGAYTNYFYDGSKTGVKFSIAKYLSNYKTLADDGITRLQVGSTAGALVTNVNDYDLCTPTHVVIQTGFNDLEANWAVDIQLMIDRIKEEYPDMIIIISTIDAAGTYYPELYPQLGSEINLLGDSLHAKMYNLISAAKDFDNPAENIFYCPNYFIQPTAWGVAYREVNHPESMLNSDFIFKVEHGAGNNYHPNAFAHAAWGYQLYALIKYTLTL